MHSFLESTLEIINLTSKKKFLMKSLQLEETLFFNIF